MITRKKEAGRGREGLRERFCDVRRSDVSRFRTNLQGALEHLRLYVISVPLGSLLGKSKRTRESFEVTRLVGMNEREGG